MPFRNIIIGFIHKRNIFYLGYCWTVWSSNPRNAKKFLYSPKLSD